MFDTVIKIDFPLFFSNKSCRIFRFLMIDDLNSGYSNCHVNRLFITALQQHNIMGIKL